jgi:LemA protein
LSDMGRPAGDEYPNPEEHEVTTTSPYPTTSRPRGGLPKWAIPVGAALAVLFLVVAPIVSSRNRLINKDEAVNQQFAQIDVDLQRRYDLIPNLVAATKAVLQQEQKVFIDIANARAQYGAARTEDDKVAASNNAESALGRLLVIVENNPDLKSNQTVQNLMTQLEGTENRIAQERRVYNEIVTDYNKSIRRFPTNIVAGISRLDRRPLLVSTAASREAPKVDLGTSPSASPSASAG